MHELDIIRVCVYCDTWSDGGIEAFITETLLHMDRTKLSVDIICAQKEKDCGDERLRNAGLEVRSIQQGHRSGAMNKTLGSILPLYRLLRNQQYDVIHLNVFHALSLWLAVVARVAGVKKIIVHCHGAGFRKSRGSVIKYVVHYLSRIILGWTPTECWASSKNAADFMFLKRRTVQIIPNGIDTKRFLFQPKDRDQTRKELRAQTKKILGCVGRIDAQKNQVYLLELLLKLKKEEPNNNTILLLVGDGPDVIKLKNKAKSMGILDDVRFYGYSENVQNLMWAMDILLVPSLSEGLCIAAIEGQAAGLPVFCSTGVPKEVGACQSVRFIALNNPDRWIEEIMCCSYPDRLQQNACVRESQFNIKNSSKIVQRAYESSNCNHI